MVTSVMIGFGTIGVSASHPDSGHQGGNTTAGGTCSLSPAVVGGPLTITGQGFKAGAHYTLDVTWPYGGTGFLFATADSTGAWVVYTQATWPGTYSVAVLGSKGGVVASCSETVGQAAAGTSAVNNVQGVDVVASTDGLAAIFA